jgi:hypothetical protein
MNLSPARENVVTTPKVIELRIGEIAKDRGRRGSLHRLRVVRLLPACGFRCMTCRADFAAHEMSRIVSPRSALQREDGADEDQQDDPGSPSRNFGVHCATEKGIIPSEAPSSGTDFTIQ